MVVKVKGRSFCEIRSSWSGYGGVGFEWLDGVGRKYI